MAILCQGHKALFRLTLKKLVVDGIEALPEQGLVCDYLAQAFQLILIG